MSSESHGKKDKAEATSQKPNDDAKLNDDQLPIAAPVAQEDVCEIFKLDVDCCEELFEWLSIADLHSFSQTCKRMQRIAGMFFRQNYPNARMSSRPDGLYDGYDTRVNGFDEFIEDIEIEFNENSLNQLAYIAANCKSLRKIEFWSQDPIISGRLRLISDVLAKVKSLFISGEHPDDSILDFCPNLKHLIVCWKNTDWLFKLNKCPKLEQISLMGLNEQVLVNVEAIFTQKSIRTVEMNTEFLMTNKDALDINVKLDNLIIDFCDNPEEVTSVCAILNKLHERGFYKRLHFINMDYVDQQLIDEVVSLRALETLDIGEVEEGVVWPVMQNVKKISVGDLSGFDLTTLPSKLPNLQWICLPNDSMEAIMPFIGGSKQLSRIKMGCSISRRSSKNILHLSALAKEREKLIGACKLTIYVVEEMFLKTKFAIGTSRRLIEIKRFASLKWNESYYWYLT
ncbi:uncharacterized protein LOC129570326 [Sitodiplosis mosellana]|uniref:uncharacterized protein LOC129570326 n=1 Tax=Sitodiplosis mosellana TaxID=263140 RepID=UPI002443AEF7|nr:uncharacterized protein LOC129570326 [Sitodiplosis mosellana]